MKKNAVHILIAALTLALLLTVLTGCGKKAGAAETAEPVSSAAPVSTTEPAAESAENRPSVPGTWQTASMAYEADGTMYPEYCVQFTDTEIVYGHMKDGEFIPDHSDSISLLEETAVGRFRIQATGSNGVQYTYQTSEGDDSVLEYYETWQEEDFPDMYRGGASLSRFS